MNTFNANFSSSPASHYLPSDTPPRRRNVLSSVAEPASTTPAAPPPSQVFGSSQFDKSMTRLQFGKDDILSSAPRQFQSSRTRQSVSDRPKSRLFQYSTNTDGSEMDDDYTSDGMDEDWEDEDPQISTRNQQGLRSVNRDLLDQSAPSLMRFSTDSRSQPVAGLSRKSIPRPSRSQLPRKGRDDLIPGLARDITRRAPLADLMESDTVILDTEQVCRQLEEACQNAQDDLAQYIVISGAAQELIHIWRRNSRPAYMIPDQGHIGPRLSEPAFEKARYISTLLLELHHPQGQLGGGRQSLTLSASQASLSSPQPKPIPQVILEWMKNNHVDYNYLYEQVLSFSPNGTACDLFWEAVETLVLRGHFSQVMHILAEADFKYAIVDTSQGFVKANYSGTQLQSIQQAILFARQVLNACPALQNGNWNVCDQEWDAYRKYVEEGLGDLVSLADEHEEDGKTQNPIDLFGTTTRKNGLPYDVYQHLKTVYQVLLGDAEVIIGLCQDWLEASLLLTVWWNGTEEVKVAQWSFDVSRANHSEAEITTTTPYMTRLRKSFLCVTDPAADGNFQINTMSPVEVGIGAVLQSDMQSVMRILQSISLCVASSVSEVGTWAGWLTAADATTGFDQDDLMVLNFGASESGVGKDQILTRYAQALFDRQNFRTMDNTIIEGWEVAFAVASRMENQADIQSTISNFLDALPIDDRDRTEKLVTICQQLGLQEQGRKVSEAFGDHLVNTTVEYGTALLCYARAYSDHKVRQLVDLLNSYCLVQSKAYPPDTEMDPALKRLVSNPREALQHISEIDPQAADALQFYLVGYACIRRFYTLRDGSISAPEKSPALLGSLAQKRASAKALISAINSAADSVYGGLYDETRRSAIQVDGLLTLLGEATALLAHAEEKRVLTQEQMYCLLAAIEDLETVSDRVFQATQDCMEAALRNYHGSLPPSPHTMLKKSVSSGTNSNFSFSMMGSEMLARSEESLGGKSLGSAVLVGKAGKNGSKAVERGWDWRARFKDHGTNGTAVLRVLRTGIAKELSVAALEDNEAVV